jgi:hypothetical protein
LTQHSGWKVRVFVVWEPILVTDWGAPSGSTLARISDARARQFWDPNHEVSVALEKMAREITPAPRPNSGRGFYWDMAIVFAPQARWENDPPPLFWRGPVYQIIPALEGSLSRQ